MAKSSTKQSTDENLTKDQLVTKSYGIALQRLKDAHIDEYNRLRIAAAQELGVEWKPQPTKEEKAEAEIRRLVAENPGLADRYPNLLKGNEEETPPEEPEQQGEPDTKG